MKGSSKQCLLQAVEGMKVLCYELMEATAGRASPSTLGNCAAQADGLVKELTAKVHQVSTPAGPCCVLLAKGTAEQHEQHFLILGEARLPATNGFLESIFIIADTQLDGAMQAAPGSFSHSTWQCCVPCIALIGVAGSLNLHCRQLSSFWLPALFAGSCWLQVFGAAIQDVVQTGLAPSSLVRTQVNAVVQYCLQVFDAAIQDMERTGLAPSSRGCKYALNTLMQTFQLRTMATNIASRTVRASSCNASGWLAVTAILLKRPLQLCHAAAVLAMGPCYNTRRCTCWQGVLLLGRDGCLDHCSRSASLWSPAGFAHLVSLPVNTLHAWWCPAASQCAVCCLQLRECCAALLVRLLDKQVPKLQEGTQLLKALNVLMLKILDHANRQGIASTDVSC